MFQHILHLLRFVRREEGPTAVEYAVMLALVILVAFTAVALFGTNLSQTYDGIVQTMQEFE